MTSQSENEKYKLVFRGALAKGVAASEAKRNVGQLFKIDANKVDALFSGKPTVLKRDLSLDVATKYRVAIKKAGALVDVELQQAVNESATANANPMAAEPRQEKVPGAIPGTEPTVAQKSQHEPSKQPAEDDFQLAPVGADLLTDNEKNIVEPREVDVSALSLKEQAGNLLNADEYPVVESVTAALGDFDLAAPGADVLTPEERAKPVVQKVDTSALSLAEPGVKLSPEKPSPPPAPDVSRITLADEG